MWRRIFQFLSPVQQWELEDTFFEFQDAVSYDIDEVVALRKRAIDVFRGFQPGTFEPWLTQQGPDAKTYVIFLFSIIISIRCLVFPIFWPTEKL